MSSEIPGIGGNNEFSITKPNQQFHQYITYLITRVRGDYTFYSIYKMNNVENIYIQAMVLKHNY